MRIATCVALLPLVLLGPSGARAQGHLDQLLKSLEGIACPVDYAVLVGIEETQDYKTRTDAIVRILENREAIHSRSDLDDFAKAEIVVNALHLLDEYDLPLVDGILDRLSREEDWKPREKALLAFLSAKRDIRYEPNVAYLLGSLSKNSADLERPSNREVAWTVSDVSNCLSYLGDLFILKGDERILNALFGYASIAYGYPAEYFSDRLVDMFLKRPELFVSSLAGREDRIRKDVTNAIVFGIRNDSRRKDLDDVLHRRLEGLPSGQREVVALLEARADALQDQWSRESEAAKP